MTPQQTVFARALLDPSEPAPHGLTDPKGRPAGKRFDVYRNNVVHSLLEAMQTAFPVIEKLLGPALFRKVAIDYIRQNPPRTPLLMFYGAGFDRFLQNIDQLSKYPFLANVARLELLRRQSYHAADADPIKPETLAGYAPEKLGTLRFDFTPSLHLLDSDYPVVGIWEYNSGLTAKKPAPAPQSALISRPAFDPVVRLIPRATSDFLYLLQQGKTLGAGYDAIQTRDHAFDLGSALGLMLETKIITKTIL